jgi:hypothetical protein
VENIVTLNYEILSEISLPWSDLDQGLSNDAIFLYNTQFVVLYRSIELLG